MTRTLIVAFFAVLVIFSFGCVPYWIHYDVANRCRQLEQSIDGHQKEHAKDVADVQKANAERDRYKLENERLNEIVKANEKAIEDFKKWQEKFKTGLIEDVKEAGLQEQGVKITEEGTIAIEGEVLFDPGKDVLKKEAKNILTKLIPVLQKYEGYYFRIDGHTDDQPIKVSGFKSNFHLGAMRALAVLDELRKLGISEDKMFIASYGEYRPAAPNAPGKKGAKENRRVEIAVVKTAR
jgi:chemotaxis protein MotB